MRDKIRNFGKKFARGTNPNQRYIYGQENINWAGPQRAAEEDAAMQRQDFMDIARDFTETTNAAAVAHEEGDMDAYQVLTEEAARIYSAHRAWDHFAKSRPEKMDDVNMWRHSYRRFREDSGLTDEHEGNSVTDRYRNIRYNQEDWNSAVEGVEDAVHQYDRIKKARQTYQDRVNGDRREEPTPASLPQDDDYSDHGPKLSGEDYTDLNSFLAKVKEMNYPTGSVMNIGDSAREQKIMRTLVSWGICEEVGDGAYSMSASKEDIDRAAEEIGHRASGGTPTRPVHGGKYLGAVDGKHSFQERPEPTHGYIREMVVDDNTVSIPHGSQIHQLSQEQKEQFLMTAIAQKDIPCTITRFQVEETGEIISINPEGKIATYQRYREKIARREKVDPNAMMAMVDDGFLPSDYSAQTMSEHYSDGRLLENAYNTSATNGGRRQAPPRSSTTGTGGGRNDREDPPTMEFPRQPGPDPGSGPGGAGQQQKRSGSGTTTKPRRKKKESPILQRTSRGFEQAMGVSGFGSTRLTGRKRVGPFVINTGLGGVAGVSSISLDLGPVMWSIWSKNYKSGFSSVDLPGMLSFRGNRQRK